MATQLTRIRFTGERTHHAAIALPRFGRVAVGDEIEVSPDIAERWVGFAPDGKSDWAYVDAPAETPAETPAGVAPAPFEEVIAEIEDAPAAVAMTPEEQTPEEESGSSETVEVDDAEEEAEAEK